jgi:hypothetical protein
MAAVGTEAAAGGVLATEAGAAGAAGAAGLGLGATIALTAGIAIVVIGAVGLAYYLYKRSHPDVPAKPKAVVPCPENPAENAPKPNIKPKPIPLDQRIPDPARREKVARDKTAAREKKCNELWDKIQKMTNNRRKRRGLGTQGLKYRYLGPDLQ